VLGVLLVDVRRPDDVPQFEVARNGAEKDYGRAEGEQQEAGASCPGEIRGPFLRLAVFLEQLMGLTVADELQPAEKAADALGEALEVALAASLPLGFWVLLAVNHLCCKVFRRYLSRLQIEVGLSARFRGEGRLAFVPQG